MGPETRDQTMASSWLAIQGYSAQERDLKRHVAIVDPSSGNLTAN